MELLSLILSPNFLIGAGIVLAILIALSLAKAYRRVVEPNEVHVVRGKKGTTIYGQQDLLSDVDADSKIENTKAITISNAYMEWPTWWPFIGVQAMVLPLSVFREPLSNYEAYDVGRLPFMVDIVAFFRISDPQTAARRISSMEELKAQLRSILEGAVRTILAKHDIEAIMSERSKFGEMFTLEVAHNLKSWGVSNVKNIELMDIRDGKDSKTVSNIMAKKESLIEKESRVEVAANKRAAEVAEIAARQEVAVRAQEAEQAVGQRTAEKDKNVGIANEQAQQEIKVQAKVTAERDMEVQQVREVRAAEIARSVRIVKAEEQKQVDVTETEGEKQKTILIAEGVLKEQQLKGEGILAVGQAEAEAKRLGEMATVTPQIELAREIGENEGYQTYLVQIRNVEKDEAVGIEQAKALQAAGIKVIANTGNVNSGVSGVMDLFSSKGGTALGGMVEAFAQTPEGSAVMEAILSKVSGTAARTGAAGATRKTTKSTGATE